MAYSLIAGAGLEAVYLRSDRRWKKPDDSPNTHFKVFDDLQYLDRRAPLLPSGLRSIELSISGLMCASCIWLIERLPFFIEEISEARVDYGASRLRILFKSSPGVLKKTADLLSKLGFRVSPQELDLQSSRIPKKEWLRLGITGLSAAGAMHVGLVLLGAHQTDIDIANARAIGLIAGGLAIPALTFGAWPFFCSAILRLKQKNLSSDLLISLAVIIGSLTSFANALIGKIDSYFDALAMVVFLLLGGRILVRLSTLKVVSRSLWWGRLNNALVPAESLKRGDSIEIQPGEIVPVDSELISAEGWFDLSSVTGESGPVQLIAGQQVLQGSLSSSTVQMRVIETVNQSYLERLASSLRLQTWISSPPRYETYFTIIVLLLSLGVLVFGGQNRISQSIALLIVSCPCALQLAYPLGIATFKQMAFKNGFYLLCPERALHWSQVTDIYFDKTGTLSRGLPELVSIKTIEAVEENNLELNAIVWELASRSQHPLAKKLREVFTSRERTKTLIQNIREQPGVGIFGEYNSKKVSIKKARTEQGMSSSLFVDSVEALRFKFRDIPRAEAADSLRLLKQDGYRLHLLSGDQLGECENFAKDLGVNFDSIQGAQSPTEKAAVQHAHSALIGDGLNDIEAMQAAGTSLGFIGSAEANLKAADCHLFTPDLSRIPLFINLAKKTLMRIRLSLGVSLAYNSFAVVLVLLGYLGPILCAIFMPLSSLTVVGIALVRSPYLRGDE